MKFTLNWLKRHLETTASLEDICAALTSIGLEVERVENRAAAFASFKVAYVEKAEQHPDADRLKVCSVKTADGTLQVVCGAPNARTGMKGIFAPEGSLIPGTGTILKKGIIRGVESNGMLVSMREMGLSEEQEGIIEVDESIEIGTGLADLFGLNDPVIEINLTPNRADCAGVRGVARDLAAAGLGILKPLEIRLIETSFKSPVDVIIDDKDGCRVFLGRLIEGVKNGPSPAWMQSLLKSAGLRPISALVDITNFISLDVCRPLHVYDADKLQGDITVRASKKSDEAFMALNDKRYEPGEGAIVITDKNGVLGLGGIIGGASTGCTADTVNVFVECAWFNPARISRTGRDLQINSDARYRFERGVDPDFIQAGLDMATNLIQDICGGAASEIVQAGALPEWKRSIHYDPAYLNQLIGIDVPAARQKLLLESLGCIVTGDDVFEVEPPSWRGDIEGRADLTEEIARLTGYDHIPVLPVRSAAAVPLPAETKMLSHFRAARHALAARGLDECLTWSFMSKDLAARFAVQNASGVTGLDTLTLSNPISAELNQMRPSILPNLIGAAAGNAARGFADTALYEVGPAFRSVRADGQDMVAAGIRAGAHASRHWGDEHANRDHDVFDVKADAWAVLEACGVPASRADITRDAPPWYHPGRSGALRLGQSVLGYFGEIHPGILQQMNVKMTMSGFEIFLNAMPDSRKKSKALLKLDALQPVSRDFAFLVDANVEAETLARAARGADKVLIKDAYIFDVYSGKGVEPGKKSIALGVTLQPQAQSLTDKDLEVVSKKITDAVIVRTGGTLRT